MFDLVVLGVSIAAIFSILVCGQYVLTGLCGQLSVMIVPYAVIGMITFTYYGGDKLAGIQGKNLSFIAATAIAIGCTSLVAFIYSALTYRLRSTRELLASLLAFVLLIGIVRDYSRLQGLAFGVSDTQDLHFGGLNFISLKIGTIDFSRTTSLMIFSLALMVFVFIYTSNLSRSPLARKMRAVASNELAAATNGISSFTTIVQANVFAGASMAIVGILLAYMMRGLPWHVFSVWVAFEYICMIQVVLLTSITLMRKLSWTVLVSFAVVFLSVSIMGFVVDHFEIKSVEYGAKFVSIVPIVLLSLVVLFSLHVYARNQRRAL